MDSQIQPIIPNLRPKENRFLNRKFLWFIITVLIIIVVIASSYWWQAQIDTSINLFQPPVHKDLTVGWTTYTNIDTDYSFEFKYPTQGEVVGSLQSENAESRIIVFPSLEKIDSPSTTLNIWFDVYGANFNGDKSQFAGKSAYISDQKSKNGEDFQRIAIKGITADLIIDSGYSPIFRQILSTFKFIDINSGFIEGSLGYPSEGIPNNMIVCAENITTKKVICTEKHIIDKQYMYGEGYRLEVPVGNYYIYSTTKELSDYKAYYDEFVTCGIKVGCESHKPIVVEVKKDQTRTKIDPQDWYQ